MPTWKGIVGQGFTAVDFSSYIATLTFTSWRPQFVVLHNTFDPTLAHWHDAPGEARMRNLQSYYRDTMGWSAGPHLFVADDLIWVFTPLTTSGIHSPSWNPISWGVEMVGDYSTEPFGPAVRDNAVSALAALHQLVGLDPNTLHFHKEDLKTTHKDCPGKNVVKADMIQAIIDKIAANNPGEHSPDSSAADVNADAADTGG
jgi:N-acetylmuramoyl-L-alanine amidase